MLCWHWVSTGTCTDISLGLRQKVEVVHLIGCVEERTLDYACRLGQRQLPATHGSLEHLESARR